MLAVEDFIILTIVCLFLGIEIFFLIKASKGKHAWQRRSEYQKLSALVTAAACVILGIAFCNRDFDDDFFEDEESDPIIIPKQEPETVAEETAAEEATEE